MCCEKQEAIDSEEEKSILEKTVEEMVEENHIKNKYIAKIRAERKEFAEDAIKNEELKEIINTHDLEILKAKDKIDDLETQLMRHINKNTTDAETQTNNSPKKSISVQTSPVMNTYKSSSVQTEITQWDITDWCHENQVQEEEIKNMKCEMRRETLRTM
ncbi:hypothetical protein JTB14_022233 [Gonioctena quinquepunctata]|nr:hypothetical protein JTB14_022233 [Gonioctena quinquepunctata]